MINYITGHVEDDRNCMCMYKTTIYVINIVKAYMGSCRACQETRKRHLLYIIISGKLKKKSATTNLSGFFVYAGNKYLILVNFYSYSKWIEICKVRNTVAEETVEKLENIKITFGLPEGLVTHNDLLFTSHFSTVVRT